MTRFLLHHVDHMKRPTSQLIYAEECSEKPSCGALVLDDPLSRQLHREFHEAQESIESAVEDAVKAWGETLTSQIEDLKSTTDARLDGFRQQIEAAASDPAASNRSKVSRS